MISIVIPIYNALEYVEQTIASIFETTESEFELILIDDASTDLRVLQFLEGLSSPQVKIAKIFSTVHHWANYGWNLGALLAEGEYIAIMNSDIVLSKGWDKPLIEALKDCTIACPTEIKKNKDKTFLQELHPLVREIDPNMINGSCFMFKKIDYRSLFPIPRKLAHWCGDNWLADRANQMRGVKFTKATFKHFLTRSSSTIPIEEYRRRVLTDLEEYERISDRNMKKIKEKIQNNVQ